MEQSLQTSAWEWFSASNPCNQLTSEIWKWNKTFQTWKDLHFTSHVYLLWNSYCRIYTNQMRKETKKEDVELGFLGFNTGRQWKEMPGWQWLESNQSRGDQEGGTQGIKENDTFEDIGNNIQKYWRMYGWNKMRSGMCFKILKGDGGR